MAAAVDATPAQVALAWILSHGEGIAPIPGTKRVERLDENAAADTVELTGEQLDRLTRSSRRWASATRLRTCPRSSASGGWRPRPAG